MEEEAVSFNFYDSSHHGFAEKNAHEVITDEGNPLETPTVMDDDFEFTHIISSDYDATAGEIFREGQIRPVFNRDLLTRNDSDQRDRGKKLASRREEEVVSSVQARPRWVLRFFLKRREKNLHFLLYYARFRESSFGLFLFFLVKTCINLDHQNQRPR